MKGRHKSRVIALRVLFQRDIGGRAPTESLQDALSGVSPEVADYAKALVEGTLANLADIDRLLRDYASGWEIDRMPAVDRNLLRLGIYELRFRTDIPVAVAIDEAVELAKKYSTAESGRFVNGVLASLARATEKLQRGSPHVSYPVEEVPDAGHGPLRD